MRANKDDLFEKYINIKPRSVIPAEAGIQSLQLRKKSPDARLQPSLKLRRDRSRA